MTNRTPAQLAAATVLAVIFIALSSGEPLHRSDPAKGFDPRIPAEPMEAETALSDPARVNPASPIYELPQHGNVNGGVDHGYRNVGVIFGARIYSGNLAQAVELFYYIPSDTDNFYRAGDYRASTGPIGVVKNATDHGEYYCPEGYAAVGLQGASGLGVDRVGLICGEIGNLSKTVALPVFGGNGGNAFSDNCASTPSIGFLTGVRVRSGMWMDSIQGLCQAPVRRDPPHPTTRVKQDIPVKLADDLAASISVGATRSNVLEKLGPPSSKISGDFERFSYQLQSGGTLRIEFEDGRVTRIQKSN